MSSHEELDEQWEDAVERDSPAQWNPENRRRANRSLIYSIADYWDLVPDQRFGQLLKNLSREEEGFADTWEWTNAKWNEQLTAAYNTLENTT